MVDTCDAKVDHDLEPKEERDQDLDTGNEREQLQSVVTVGSGDCALTHSALVDAIGQTENEKAVETLPISISACLPVQALPEIDTVKNGVSLISDSQGAHEDAEKVNSILKESDDCHKSSLFAPVTSGLKEEATGPSTVAHVKSEDCDDNYGSEADTVPLPTCSSPVTDPGICQSLGNVEENLLLSTETNDENESKDTKQGVSMVIETTETEKEPIAYALDAGNADATEKFNKSFNLELSVADGYESGTEDEQAAFRRDVENFYRRNGLEFKAPKFYKEELNLLKLWRAVIKLGGYEQVTSCKLWRQVGESFRPPKTCTTVSWTFRIFYEKALFEYEKHKLRSGELPFSDGPLLEAHRVESQAVGNQALAPGRARRDAAARAMQGWHSQRLLDNGEVCHPIIKNKNLSSFADVDKQTKTNGSGLLKRKRPLGEDHTITPVKALKSQSDTSIIDIGPPAEWVKINVRKTSDSYEIYALVPGLLREEVHVQSDPAGRVIIFGQPEQLDNPWGITPFKKVVSLPSRIDPHNTSAVVTLHGQLFVRVPFEAGR